MGRFERHSAADVDTIEFPETSALRKQFIREVEAHQ
jgi:hypothetical protein